MSETAARPMTVADFLQLDDPAFERAELIDAVPVLRPLTTGVHQELVSNLGFAIRSALPAQP